MKPLLVVLTSLLLISCEKPKNERDLMGPKGDPGRNGLDGRDGIDGQDGDSCRVESTEGGLNIFCGDSDPVFFPYAVDGVDGVDGMDGQDGESCTIKSMNRDYTVLQCPDESGTGVTEVKIRNGRDGEDGKDAESCRVDILNNTTGPFLLLTCPNASYTIRQGIDGADGRDGKDGQDNYTTTLSEPEISGLTVGSDTIECYAEYSTNDQYFNDRWKDVTVFNEQGEYLIGERLQGGGVYSTEVGSSFRELPFTSKAGDILKCQIIIYAENAWTYNTYPTAIVEIVESEAIVVGSSDSQ